MIIIDIDMPTGCSSCPIYDGEYGECQLRTCFPSRFADVHALFDDRPNNCPLKDRTHGEWILVSDRLPEEDGRFLVFLPDRNGTFMCADFLGGKWYPDDYECTSNHVIAWMPLPSPYKKGGDEK